jgi:hypothetical protein
MEGLDLAEKAQEFPVDLDWVYRLPWFSVVKINSKPQAERCLIRNLHRTGFTPGESIPPERIGNHEAIEQPGKADPIDDWHVDPSIANQNRVTERSWEALDRNGLIV